MTGLAKPGETRGLTGTGPGLARQESAGRVFGRFWNRTDPFLQSKPGPLAGYPDPLLTLRMSDCSSCSRTPCLAIVADMLKAYETLVDASNNGIRLLPLPYTLP
jgi:hypothetical protein